MKTLELGGKAKQVNGGQSLGFVMAAAALGLLAAFVATAVATHLEQPPEPDMTENFQFLPNEFLNLTDRPRLLFRRVVPTDG